MKKTTDYLFLVYSKSGVKNIAFEELSANGKIIKGNGSQNVAEHDLLVFDGNSYTANELKDLAKYAKDALDSNTPVLILGSTKAHKSALSSMGALGSYIEEDSAALYIEPRYDANGNQRIALAEQFFPNSNQAKFTRSVGQFDNGKSVSLAEPVVLKVETLVPTVLDYAKFLKRVKGSVETLSSGVKLSQTDDTAPNNPPGNIPSGLYDVTPVTMYWSWAPGGAPASGYTPPAGSITLEGLVTIGVYYDNKSFNSPVQWLLIEHSGLYSTAGLEANDNTHIGWSVGALSIDGQNISSKTMVSKQSSPNNVNGQTQYTSGTEFSVGISAGTDGLSANASYTISSSQTSSIMDWTIVQSDPNTWNFAQSVPYNGNNKPGSFPNGAAGSGGVAALPPISVGSLAFDTQSVWAQLPATQTNISVPYSFAANSFFTYADATGKSWHAWCWTYAVTFNQTYAVNFSNAWPS